MNKVYQHFGKVVLRTPLHSLSFLKKQVKTENALREFINDKVVLESLYLASPVLYQQLLKWQNGSGNGKDHEKLAVALFKYYIRMVSRCTPFGLFASCSVVDIKPGTSDIYIQDPLAIKRHSRLDMRYLCALSSFLESDAAIRKILKYRPNSSLYFSFDQIRYVENRKKLKLIEKLHVVAVERDDLLDMVLKQAERGLLISEIVELLMGAGIESDNAHEYVNELIDAQVLISDLEPAVTGQEFAHDIINTLSPLREGALQNTVETIEEIIADLKDLDAAPLGHGLGAYEKISTKLSKFDLPIVDGQLFQVDTTRPVESGIFPQKYFSDVMKGVDVLLKLHYAPEITRFESFVSVFRERYEGQEVPLTDVLDTDLGIGFDQDKTSEQTAYAPLIDGIPFALEASYSKVRWNKVQSFLLEQLTRAIYNGETEIRLKDADLQQFRADAKLSDTFSVIFSVLSSSEKNDVNRILLRGVVGPNAGVFLGRFCHASPDMFELIGEISSREKDNRPDALHAEIVHLPESRIGNLLLRPVLREYEIPYLGKSGVHPENQISIRDLMISFRNGRLVLRSKTRNKEVIPYLTTAHPFHLDSSLPIYHFLSAYALQNVERQVLFDWGPFQRLYKFTPRVVYQNIVLALATWKFEKAEFQVLLDTDDIHEDLKKWRVENKLPAQVWLNRYGDELYIDFNNALCAKVFLHEIRNKATIFIVEFIHDDDHPPVNGVTGPYMNEYILPVFKKPSEKSQIDFFSNHDHAPGGGNLKREFSLGDEWMYVKLYSGVEMCETVLRKQFFPLINDLLGEELIDRWFFVRYYDQANHIRLRFHLTNRQLFSVVLERLTTLLNELAAQKKIWKFQYDTYSREIERYGSNTMELSEAIFYHDSAMILRLLSALGEEEDEKTRYMCAIKAAAAFLDDFQFSSEERIKFLRSMRDGFYNEFQFGHNKKQYLDNKYRMLSKDVARTLNDADASSFYNQVIGEKSRGISDAVCTILSYKTLNTLDVDLWDFVASHIHMMINRIFKSKQRAQELVVYDFLFRHFDSSYKRESSGNSK